MTKTLLEIHNLSHSYAKNQVLKELSIQVEDGEILCILGPSGCGKSTLLQSIAGFVQPDSGEIKVKEKILSGPTTHIAPEKRGIGLVFQDYSLFPHLNVKKNIAYGISHLPLKKIEDRVSYLLGLIGLNGYQEKYPHELSGGEQQRIAIARALAPEPNFLLLDEPFSNLDPSLRDSLAKELKNILKANKVTAIFITHDQKEAFLIGDRVAILNDGHIHQVDSPQKLCHQPETRFVAKFLGNGQFLAGISEQGSINTILGDFELDQKFEINDKVEVFIPSQSFILGKDSKEGSLAKIEKRVFCGDLYHYDVMIKEAQLQLKEIPSCMRFEEGDDIWLKVETSLIHKAFKKY